MTAHLWSEQGEQFCRQCGYMRASVENTHACSGRHGVLGPAAGAPLVSLALACEALADVLVDYDVPTGRIVTEFRQTVSVYEESADA